jgi:hypothetical protein
MTYYQTLIDDFNDNSFNTGLWTSSDTSGLTETSGQLHIHAVSAYSNARSPFSYDITTAILAIKVTNTNAASASTEFYFAVKDSGGNGLFVLGTPNSAGWTFDVGGATTVSSRSGEGAGLGTGWTNGNWMGLGNLGADNIIHLYKSSDGQTWTEVGHCTVGGTLDKTALGLFVMTGCFSGTTTYQADFDDASCWSQTPPASSDGFFAEV